MAEVIDLKRRKAQEKKRRTGQARRRAEAVAAALSCGCCPRRCSHCGLPIENEMIPEGHTAPYGFCAACMEEYRAYKRQESGGEKEVYWHTQEWFDMWHAWVEHQEASAKFRSSPMFLKLMQENMED